MTDFSASDDELLSSFIDGDLTADERARLEARLAAEPEMQARLAQLRGAAALTATPVPPLDTAHGDSLIAAAIAAGSTTPDVTDLAAARAARTRRWGVRIATAAAGVLLLAVALPNLVDRGDSDDDFAGAGDAEATAEIAAADSSRNGAADDGGDDGGGGSEFDAQTEDGAAGADESELADAPEADGAGDGTTDDVGATMAPGTESLKSFAFRYGIEPFADGFTDYPTTDALRNEIVDRYDAVAASILGDGTETNEGSQDDAANLDDERRERLLTVGLGDCVAEIGDLEAALAPILAVDDATATVNGAPVAILLYALADGRVVAHVVDASDCTVIESVELNPAG